MEEDLYGNTCNMLRFGIFSVVWLGHPPQGVPCWASDAMGCARRAGGLVLIVDARCTGRVWTEWRCDLYPNGNVWREMQLMD